MNQGQEIVITKPGEVVARTAPVRGEIGPSMTGFYDPHELIGERQGIPRTLTD